MAKIEDLIAQIPDERLRKGIAAEVKALKKTKTFGLVFEEHLPETVRLPKLPVKPGEVVAIKREYGSQLWRVKSIRKEVALCEHATEGYPASSESNKEVPVTDLVVVRSFGEPIYPALVPIDRIDRGGPDKPWHVLINADNFHALQLLLYCYETKVDVIYIDPPYNTGARDWKYNNDYVDKTDSFRHSKWLSMMKKRLTLAKRLLKPDGVLIITIDENEVNHLGALLEEHLREYARQMITIVINEKGVAQGRLSRVEEHAFFCFGPQTEVPPQSDDLLSPDRRDAQKMRAPRWERLLRGGAGARRRDSPNLFYPVYVDPKTSKITGVGEALPLAVNPKITDNKTEAWPIRTDGSQGRWRASPATLRDYLKKGYAKVGGYDARRKTWTVLYLGRKAQRQIEKGSIRISGRNADTGAVNIEYTARGDQRSIKTVWHRGTHDSGNYGSTMLSTLLGETGVFAYPKSLYAVRDTLQIVSTNKPNALVLDFFAGSGTTLHATALLNAEFGGNRRCILVTNNEVSEKNEKVLAANGHFPGDSEYERHGVAESVAWPRCKACITGEGKNGSLLEGDYLNGRQLQEGFDENVEYFRLDFLDPNEVARGDAFKAIVPILWMVAGCRGEREDSKGSTPWFIPKHSPFAVLIQEKQFRGFREKLAERKDIEWVFLITDSEENFGQMRRTLGRKYECVQLYKSYLENFRINTQDALNG